MVTGSAAGRRPPWAATRSPPRNKVTPAAGRVSTPQHPPHQGRAGRAALTLPPPVPPPPCYVSPLAVASGICLAGAAAAARRRRAWTTARVHPPVLGRPTDRGGRARARHRGRPWRGGGGRSAGVWTEPCPGLAATVMFPRGRPPPCTWRRSPVSRQATTHPPVRTPVPPPPVVNGRRRPPRRHTPSTVMEAAVAPPPPAAATHRARHGAVISAGRRGRGEGAPRFAGAPRSLRGTVVRVPR